MTCALLAFVLGKRVRELYETKDMREHFDLSLVKRKNRDRIVICQARKEQSLWGNLKRSVIFKNYFYMQVDYKTFEDMIREEKNILQLLLSLSPIFTMKE